MNIRQDATEMVRLQGVSKHFGKIQALRNVDMTVTTSMVMALIGPSGSGKSTLLRCINALEILSSGSIWVNGHTLNADHHKEEDIRAVRRSTGMVFQSFNLFPHLTVLDNITMAPRVLLKMPREEAAEMAHTLLKQVHLPDRENAYPDRLSGGQQQRVAIARALAMRPTIMLFDEVTSALDPEMIKEVLSVIQELAIDGMTMIVASHEMGFVRAVADQVLFMDHGEIVESGSAQQLFDQPREQRTLEFLNKIL